MIFDCFTFFDEFDLLELRLRTLEAVVDRFILCEAPFTFRGKPKPLSFTAHAERFTRWRARIDHVVYPGPPSDNPWQNEWGQRDFLATALDVCAPDDLVLIGDCDEIPDPQFAGRRSTAHGILGHRMLFSMGYVNRMGGTAPSWVGTRAVACEDIARYGGLSNVRKHPIAEIETIESGWHFTSLGGAAKMEQKMSAYSHYEFDIPYFRDRRRLETDFASNALYTWVPLDERFPRALRDDPYWQRHVWSRPEPEADATNIVLQHVHGCFGYVPPAAAVAVIADEPGPWEAAGNARFGPAFAGVFADVPSLIARAGARPWVVVDGLERLPVGVLAVLAAARLPVVAFATNARSYEVFGRVLEGDGTFPPGRALGHGELDAEVLEAGYTVAAVDRVFSRKISIPRVIAGGHSVNVNIFSFHNMTPDALYDFLSDAFVFTLAPPGTQPATLIGSTASAKHPNSQPA